MSPIVTPSVPHPRGMGLWSEEAFSSHGTRGLGFFGPTKALGCVLCAGLREEVFFFFWPGSYLTSWTPGLKVCLVFRAQAMLLVTVWCPGLSWAATLSSFHWSSSLLAGRSTP